MRKIKRDDTVLVLGGKDRGKTGRRAAGRSAAATW